MVVRIRYSVDLRLNRSHALDLGEQALNYARLERHKGLALCLRQQTVDCSFIQV